MIALGFASTSPLLLTEVTSSHMKG